MLSTDTYNLYKQFGHVTGMKNRGDWSGLKLFAILMVFLKEFFVNSKFKKIPADYAFRKACKVFQLE